MVNNSFLFKTNENISSLILPKINAVNKFVQLLFLLLCVIQGLFCKAQDSTIDIIPSDSAVHKKTLIIPFEPDMYMSDMDREIGGVNQLNQPQIVERFRIAFDRVLDNTLQLKHETHSLLHDETSASESQLVEIYSGISFVFTPIKRNEKERLISKVVPKKQAPKKEATIKNGEVYTVRDTIERYMKTILIDTTLLERLHEKTKAENFLFINQFELRNSFEDVMQLQNDTYERELRVHYSVLNREGKELSGGIAKCKFDNRLKEISRIVAVSFPCAAQQISNALVEYELSLVKNKK